MCLRFLVLNIFGLKHDKEHQRESSQSTNTYSAPIMCAPSSRHWIQSPDQAVYCLAQCLLWVRHYSRCFICMVVVVQSLSCVRLFETPRTIALQAALCMEFSRQEYWSGLPFPSPGVCVCLCVCVCTQARRNSAGRLLLDLDHSPSLCFQPASLPFSFQICTSRVMWTNSIKSVCLHTYIHILLVLFLWRILTNTMVGNLNSGVILLEVKTLFSNLLSV